MTYIRRILQLRQHDAKYTSHAGSHFIKEVGIACSYFNCVSNARITINTVSACNPTLWNISL